MKKVWHIYFFKELCSLIGILGLVFLLAVGMSGCKGTTITTEPLPPEDPNNDPLEPGPIGSETPVVPGGNTPTPSNSSYDSYADTPDDPSIKTLEPDSESYVVTLDYTGDIDWYKITVPTDTKRVQIALTDIPEKGDFDIVAYDPDLRELEDGRSAQSGNVSEYLLVSPTTTAMYLQIYSYNGRGKATLMLTTEEPDDYEDPGEILHLTYEELLSTYYPLYPRGSSSGLLEHAVETIEFEEITCETEKSVLEGTLTIGNYAHVERDLLELQDYIDGWALVVFDGPLQVLDELAISISVTIFATGLELEVEVPPTMLTEGYTHSTSNADYGVYYISQFYGDFWSNNSDDIQISSGILGEFGNLVANDIFTQEVEVEWMLTASDGTMCSGTRTGKQIVDFEQAHYLLKQLYPGMIEPK